MGRPGVLESGDVMTDNCPPVSCSVLSVRARAQCEQSQSGTPEGHVVGKVLAKSVEVLSEGLVERAEGERKRRARRGSSSSKRHHTTRRRARRQLAGGRAADGLPLAAAPLSTRGLLVQAQGVDARCVEGGVLMQPCPALARAWGVRVWDVRGCVVPELWGCAVHGGGRSAAEWASVASVSLWMAVSGLAATLSSCAALDGLHPSALDGASCESGCGGSAVDEHVLRAAVCVQRRWRRVHAQIRCGACDAPNAIVEGWDAARARIHGSLVSHVRYLQFVCRGVRVLSQRGWQRGSLRAPMLALLLLRRVARRRCGGGINLASESEFEEQRRRAAAALDWYAQYVSVLRRLESGETPRVLHAFCGGGGDAEGRRRAGGGGVGVDADEQPDFARRFGGDAFVRGDATSWAVSARLRDRHSLFGAMAGPPCKFYSTARVAGEARQPPLIAATRDMLAANFDMWSIENVLGARSHLREHAVELRGSLFGLAVDRPRLIEANFPLHVDECLRRPAEALRRRCCLGARRRWRELDEFGRPTARACCAGNIFAVQGDRPWRCTAEECSAAMGVDVGHMAYDRLAQSVPPAYGQLVFSQMCMWRAHRRFGAPVITYDDVLADPAGSRRRLARWLRGAGDERPDAALELRPVDGLEGTSAASTQFLENSATNRAGSRQVTAPGRPGARGSSGMSQKTSETTPEATLEATTGAMPGVAQEATPEAIGHADWGIGGGKKRDPARRSPPQYHPRAPVGGTAGVRIVSRGAVWCPQAGGEVSVAAPASGVGARDAGSGGGRHKISEAGAPVSALDCGSEESCVLESAEKPVASPPSRGGDQMVAYRELSRVP